MTEAQYMIKISDRIAIEDRLAQIAWAISQGDRAAFQAQCTADARWTVDCDQPALAWLDEFMAKPSAPGHQFWNTNIVISPITPDRVIVRSYLMVPYFGQTVVPATFIRDLGTSTDELVLTKGEWLLQSRHIVWGAPVEDVPAPAAPLADEPNDTASGKTLHPEDRLAIADLYADYAWALDTGDGWGCAEMFTPDGLLTDPGGRFEGREAIFSFLGGLHATNSSFRGRQHWVGSPLLTVDGPGQVSARAFACVPNRYDNGSVNLDLIASYFEKLVKVDGQWWFSERLITPWVGEPLALFPQYAPIGESA